jgi:hypothetical protein
MALSVCASVRGERGKPGPRVPACRELTYPAPRGSLVLPASSGKRLLPRDPRDERRIVLVRPAHRAEPIRHRVLQPDQPLAALVGLGLVIHAAERERPGYRLEGGGCDGDADQGVFAIARIDCNLCLAQRALKPKAFGDLKPQGRRTRLAWNRK